LPGEPDLGVLGCLGPGNDGGDKTQVSFMINPTNFSFFVRFGAKNVSDLPEAKLKSEHISLSFRDRLNNLK